MILRIRNWSVVFENAESRKLKSLKWVAMPNRMSTQGYTALLDHPSGVAHFGAWCAIVEICSAREPRELRGTLPEGDGTIGGISRSLGRISRMPPEIFQELLPRLIDDKEILWIESDTATSGESPGTSGDSPGIPRNSGYELKGITLEGDNKGKEGKGRKDLISQFDELVRRWQEPNPSGKVFTCADVDLGCQIWIQLIDTGKVSSTTLPIIFAGLDRWKASAQWKKGFVQSVPTWLGWSKNGTPAAPRWNDKPEPAAPESEY